MWTNSPGLSYLQTVQKPSAKTKPVEGLHSAKVVLLPFQQIQILLFAESARSCVCYNILRMYLCLSMKAALGKSHITSKTHHSAFSGCAASIVTGNLESKHIKIAAKKIEKKLENGIWITYERLL